MKRISFGLQNSGLSSFLKFAVHPIQQNGLLLSSFVVFRTATQKENKKFFNLAPYSRLISFGGIKNSVCNDSQFIRFNWLFNFKEVQLCSRLIYNSIIGGLRFWFEELELVGLGYRLTIKGNTIRLRLGFSHVLVFSIPVGIFLIKRKKKILVYSTNKETLTFFVSSLLRLRKMSVYKIKGIKKKNQLFHLKPGKKRAK